MTAQSHFERDTRITSTGAGRWSTQLSAAWNIGTNPNGGYLILPVLRAMSSLVDQPDPITVTTHYLRTGLSGAEAEIRAELVKPGRLASNLRGSMHQDGKPRLESLVAFADLDTSTGPDVDITIPAPHIPPPDECIVRSGSDQGVELALLSRAEMRLHPDFANAGSLDEPVIDGWVRFCDRTEPSTLSLPFFADCCPPSIFATHGRVGWVPTLELTVHIRRRPAPGWLQVRNRTEDCQGGRIIETGCIWDSTGTLVAQMRQVGLLLEQG